MSGFLDGMRPALRGHRHMTSAGHYLASQAGFQIMEAGGNAIDAGVAAGLVLGVVKSDLVNVAGVAPILIKPGDGRPVVSISGLGYWPKGTDTAMFAREHPEAVPEGVLRQIIPSAPDAWITALELYGSMSFGEVASAATRLASDGFVMYPLMAHLLKTYEAAYARWPSNAEIYLPGGRPPAVGDIFKQTDLGASLQYMADQETAAGGSREDGLEAARAAFYRGDIARKITKYHEENGGFLREEDMANFRVEVTPPHSVRFGDMDVYSCGTWCQGPFLLQILQLLKGHDLAALGHNSPDYIHLMAEAVKLAAADREHWYGDPNFVDVPIDFLLSEDYAAERAQMIDPDSAWAEMPPPGGATMDQPAASNEPVPLALDTSYACTIDGDGNVFSATPSDGSASGPVAPGTGMVPSTRGCQSRPDPDHPSSIAPGKRPRLTPTPGLALRGDGWAMPFGTPGGDVQCQSMAQTLINTTVFGMNPQAAVEAPRFASFSFPNSFAPHDYHPGMLKLEGRIEEATAAALSAKGHRVERWDDADWRAGCICMIEGDLENGVLTAGADFRRPATAAGW